MRLEDYIEETGIPIARLADRCDLSFHQVYHILQGGCPTLRTAIVICGYTKGRVSPKELLPKEVFKELEGEKDESQKKEA